jgi:hypothetical protein
MLQSQENHLGILLGRPKGKSRVILRFAHLIWNAELAADMVQQPALSSKLSSQGVSLTEDVPWWNKEFRCHKASMRWLFIQAKTGHWETYEIDLPCYNKQIKKAKWSSLTDYFLGIEDLPDRVRLMRITASQSALLHYLIADIHKMERKPGRKFTQFIFQDLGGVK